MDHLSGLGLDPGSFIGPTTIFPPVVCGFAGPLGPLDFRLFFNVLFLAPISGMHYSPQFITPEKSKYFFCPGLPPPRTPPDLSLREVPGEGNL